MIKTASTEQVDYDARLKISLTPVGSIDNVNTPFTVGDKRTNSYEVTVVESLGDSGIYVNELIDIAGRVRTELPQQETGLTLIITKQNPNVNDSGIHYLIEQEGRQVAQGKL
jgi:hypothetical protein